MMSRWTTLALVLILSACGREAERGLISQDVNNSLEGRALLAATTRLELNGFRFTKEDGKLIWDRAYYRQVRLERPLVTHSGEVRALTHYITTAHQVLEKFGEAQSLDIPARRDTCLEQIKAIRKHVRAEGEPETFLNDSLELAKAEDRLSHVGIVFTINAGSGEVGIDADTFATYKKAHPTNDTGWKGFAKRYVDSAQAFVTKYQQELSSQLIEKKAAAVRTLLAP